jgi:hypothetical protein
MSTYSLVRRCCFADPGRTFAHLSMAVVSDGQLTDVEVGEVELEAAGTYSTLPRTGWRREATSGHPAHPGPDRMAPGSHERPPCPSLLGPE